MVSVAEPVVDVTVQASGHQHFGSAAELRQSLVRQWPTSATPGSGREKTADDRGDRFQLLGSRVRLHAKVLERGCAEQVERIRWGEDDGARKRFVQLWDRQDSLSKRSPIAPAIREN